MGSPEVREPSRTPEESVRDLGRALAYAAETHLATLERLEMRKSVSKSDMTRQTAICAALVAQCADLAIEPLGLRGQVCSRLKERMAAFVASKRTARG